MDRIPPELRETKSSLSFDEETSVKALGVHWNPTTDSFFFAVSTPNIQAEMTKRLLLSELAKTFDPLGFLTPVTIKAKILFQDLWKLGLNWDDELPGSIVKQWIQYCEDLNIIKHIVIPRCISPSSAISDHQFHGFSDASEKAYSAVVYLRSRMQDGTIMVRIITSKTKVAPIKQSTLPRLELCGAVLLAKLVETVRLASQIKAEVIAWTDSSTVLKWLASFPSRWTTFVANRVASIQELIPVENWRFVPGKLNPADCASRGISAAELKEQSTWLDGPEFLYNLELPNFVHHHVKVNVELEEKKKVQLVGHTCVESTLISKFSSLNKLKRVTAFCLRFLKNVKVPKKERKVGDLGADEYNSAFLHWINYSQSNYFSKEINQLKATGQVSKSSILINLNPFIDKFGIIRVGGRLHCANIPESSKHPIILHHQCNLTKLIIQHHHQILLHAGVQLLLATLRQEYWILRARDSIRFITRKCVTCRRHKATTLEQLMGSLPSARVNPGRPFKLCGVDYAGPYNMRVLKGRGQKYFKSYICLFVCLATKAIHLEAVSDLTTEAFLAAFKRFISRRGLCSEMFSDCGTNFTGADKELQKMWNSASHNSTITKHLAEKGIKWNFNPPAAPHHGGLWEAGVKSVKYHLRRVIGSAQLNFEEFQTLLCQVEACLNSRPLCAITDEPSELNVLTPAHFLIGESLTTVPEPDYTDVKINRLSRWQYSQQLLQHFWKRWSAEYLTNLQQRFKWRQKRENINIGDLVLLKDELQAPLRWRMGRVAAVHPGPDGLVRVVTVKTEHGELKRPVVKLCPILLGKEQSESEPTET